MYVCRQGYGRSADGGRRGGGGGESGGEGGEGGGGYRRRDSKGYEIEGGSGFC